MKAQEPVKVIWPLQADSEAIYSSGIGNASFSYGPGLNSFKFDSLNGATAGGWDSRNLDKSDYFEYKIVPERDATITFNTLDFEVSLKTVNMRVAVHYSYDEFKTQSIPIGHGVFVGRNSARELRVETELTVKYPQTLSIRIYGWSAPSTVNFFTRNVEFNGMTIPPEPIKAKEEEEPEGGNRSILSSETYSVPGTYTWICPPNVFKVTVECWGGGGKGGDATGNNKAGGGGGGGGYSSLIDYTVAPGNSYTVTVGAGGMTLANGTTVTDGSESWFNNSATVRALGGKSVKTDNTITGGAGGILGVGSVTRTGGNGADANAITHGGGGGSSGGATGNGSNGNLSIGGIAPAGGGNGGNGHLASAAYPSGNGTDGSSPGGGGGGAISGTGSGDFVGGDGANGRVIITFCVIPTIYNVTGGGSFCANGSGVPVGLSGSNTGIRYQLYRDGIATGTPINGTGNALTFGNQTIAGTYTVIATNLDGGCTQNMAGNAIVTVNPQPTATISGTTTVCQNAPSPNITFTGSNGSPLYTFTYKVNGGSNQTITGNPALLLVPTNIVGSFIYSLVSVQDANGCSRSVSGSATVTVNPGTPAQPGAISGNASPCPALTGLQYSTTAVPNATTYTWDVPTGWSITGGQNTTTITVTAGSFGNNGDITVTASNSCGTSNASVLPVTVLPGTPATPGPITGTVNQCPNVTGQIYSITAVTNATNYTWTVPTGWTITNGQGTNSITVTTGSSGQNGNITVTASNSCGTSSARTLTVSVGQGIPNSPGGINGIANQCPNIPNIQYSINPVANATSYTWNVPTGWTITAGTGTTTITVTSGAFGNNGNITVVAVNTCGSSAAATLAVTVLPGTPAVPGPITGTIVQCGNLTGQVYSIDPVTNATTYNWTVPTGWIITGGNGTTSITVTTGTPGQNGNITVTAGNSCGTSAASTVAVTVNPGAPATPGPITGVANHCFQQNNQVYSIANVTNATTYNWSVPTGWTIVSGNGTNSITVNTGTPGQNGNITVTAGNICGTSSASTLAVTVSTVPANTSPITPAPASVCQGATLTFSVTAVAGVTYTWTFPSGWTINSGQGTNQITVVAGIQSGNISVTPSNTCGGGNATNHPVTVNPLPASAGPINGETNFCQGYEAKYTVTNSPGITYNWTVPAGWTIISGQGTNSITTIANGASGQVVVTPQNACGNGPSSIYDVTVYPKPAAETGPDGELCKGGFTNIGAPAVPGNTYSWTSNPVGFTSSLANPVVNPFENTTYYLIETTPQGCTNTNNITIITDQALFLTISPTTQTICPGEEFTITVTSNILGTTYEWKRDNIIVLTGMPTTGTTVPITGSLNSTNPTSFQTTTFVITGLSVGANCGDKLEAKVNVIDASAPEITCLNEPIRYTDEGECTYTVQGNEFDPQVSDDCAVILTNDLNGSSTLAGQILPVGVTSVTWTAIDPGGHVVDCKVDINVKDGDSPVITCPSNQLVNVTGTTCTYTHSGTGWDATATDNCSITPPQYNLTGATTGSGTSLNGQVFNLGVTTVKWTVSDGANSSFCTFTVTVVDNLPPSIICQSDVLASASTTTCNAILTLPHPVINDNCTGSTLTWTITGSTTGSGIGFIPDNYTFNVGTSQVAYIVTDQAGLTDNCTFLVTVTDNTLPIVTCPSVNDFYPNNINQCQATLSFVATATDNCSGIQSIKYYVNSAEITFPYNFPIGTTIVSVIATDVNGNASIPCTFEVEVRDTQLPVINCAASPQFRDANDGECTYVVQGTEFDPLTFSDNCPGSYVINELTGTATLAGRVLNQGLNQLIWKVYDAAGNFTECIVEVTVNDGEAPVIICPVVPTQYTGPGATSCNVVVTWPAPTGTDNCGTVSNLACIPPSGSSFLAGTTTEVTCSGNDGSGNTGSCKFTVTVIDNTPPTFNAPPDITVYTDASCNYNINPSATGNPNTVFDNCGLKPAPQSPTYTDVVEAVPPCNGNYKVTRTWRVTDINNNYTEKVQIITIRDNIPPVLIKPLDKIVECSDPPSSYGVATATDNCDTEPVISFTDEVTNDPFCISGKVINRTWRAEDCNGNFVTAIQKITVDDNTAPVIDNPGNIIVQCPSMIPTPSANGILAHDNCGSVAFEFLYDDPVFPLNATGYCPDYINRYFKAIDQCFNEKIFYQVIDVIDPLGDVCACKECLTNNSHYDIDLEQFTTVTISNVVRRDKCCNAKKQEDCISFDVYLPPTAVGVQITVGGGHPENEFWRVNCELVTFLNDDFVCLAGGNHYLFTYCKAGDNANNSYTFTVMEGVITVPNIEARVSCNSLIEVNTNADEISWQSISPGYPGQWNSYITCLDAPACTQLQFTPDANAPPSIVYEICASMDDMPCLGPGGELCAELTVHVLDAIEVTFDVDPAAYCNTNIPLITATVSPSGTTYILEWYKLPNLTTVLGTGYTYQPTSPGTYVLKVHDMENGVPCPDYYYQFLVAPDNQPPVVTPPAPLEIQCENPNNPALIAAWLASVTAMDDDIPMPIGSITNNYTGITQDCNSIVTVTFSASDECGNIGTNTSTIRVVDTERPTWVIQNLDRTVQCKDDAGLAAAQLLAPTAFDQCDENVAIVKTSGVFVPGSCPQSGTYTNTWIGTDDCGNQTATFFTQIITVTDATAPTWVTTAGNLNRNVTCNDAAGLAAAQAERPVATDNCDPTVIINKTDGIQVPGVCPTVYTITNTFTATDHCGNISSVFTQVITVSDNVAPVLTNQASGMTVECDGSGNLTELTNWLNNHGGAAATDQCDANLIWTHNFTALSDLCGATGSATVTFTAADDCGNKVSTNPVTFTIVDTQLPVISCPANATAIVDPGSCEVTGLDIGMATASDNCSGSAGIDITNDAPTAFPGGVTIVTWTATDDCGNFSTCQQTVTVEDDIPPTIECPDDVFATAPAPACTLQVVTIGYPELTDNCDISLLTLSWVKSGATTGSGTGNVNNTIFNVGVTTVEYTVTDSWGNIATCTFLVTVYDEVPPTIINCFDETIEVDNDPGICTAWVDIQTPDVIDPCGEIVSITNDFNNTSNASDDYPVGTTIVTWTITDVSGNEVTCQITVIVTDIESPVIVCPDDYESLITNGGCELEDVPVPDPVITDNCTYTVTWVMTGATTGTGTGFVGGEDFNIGITYIAYTVTDISGNTTGCAFQVWIRNLAAPEFEVDCPIDNVPAVTDSGRCDAFVDVPPPTISNPCNELYSISNDSPYQTDDENASGTYPIGSITFTWTITDASGNVTECEQTVVVSDNQLPTIACPDDVIVTASPPDCEIPNVVLGGPVIDDNCDNPVLTWEMNGPAGLNSGNGLVTQTTFPVGTTVITYFVTDASGNEAECSFNVIVRDEVPPTIVSCPPNQTVNAEDGICLAAVSIPPPDVEDECGEIVSITNNSLYGTNNLNASGNYPVGIHVITWTFTDESGNIEECTTTITVVDNQLPVIECPEDVEQEIINGGCELANVIIPNPTYSDNCALLSLTWTMTGATTGNSLPTGFNYVSGETFRVGVTTVTYRLTDVNGNWIECSFTVWIKNKVNPPFNVTCPANVTEPSEPNICGATVTVPIPGILNPCNELYTIENNSPYADDDASGFYPVGTTVVVWIITDASGNETVCNQQITITDLSPILLCPVSQTVEAEFEVNYNSNVILGTPTFSDNCQIVSLTWVSSAPTPGSSPLTGININTNTTFYVGVTTITYTATDINGNITECDFTITVISEPEIECPEAIIANTDLGFCSASLNPGGPTLISGVEPIIWTYTITNQAGTQIAAGTCTTATLPTCIGSFEFPTGVNTIHWTASNISGVDDCNQTVTVSDKEPPKFTPPVDPSFCVVDIFSAVYDGQPEPQADIEPNPPFSGLFPSNWDRPDWYVVSGTELDLTGVSDNCCLNTTAITWRIEFAGTDPNQPDISGTGQPSTYPGQIILWGNPDNNERIHKIFYTVTDCNGNVNGPVTIDIIIKPRPNVIKQ